MLYRPPPLLERVGAPIAHGTFNDKAAQRLLAGDILRVEDHYGTAVHVHEALVAALNPPPPTAGYAAKQRYREAWREAAWRLLVPIEKGRIALAGAPEVGFLAELYPELDRFWLPFPELQDLVNAWFRYDEGVAMPVLGFPLHPFYGTYLPTRTEHLELFATWLSGWKGPRDRAIDVGTGAGVLALMLAKAGFAEVIATDLNPNACESVRRELARRPAPVRVVEADLLGDSPPADLIVFNPPWTSGPVHTLLDRALHYDDDLFERFFAQAKERLSPGGRVVLVFSNVIRLVQPDLPHPIDAALAGGDWELVGKQRRRIRPTDGRRTKERVEVWELARPGVSPDAP